MNLRKLYYLMLIIPLFFFYTGCSEDPVTPDQTVNEAEVLAKFIVDNDNPLTNHTQTTMIKASAVNSNILSGANQYIIDIRSAEDFIKGHIKGAVNVSQKEVLAHYEANNLSSKVTVVVACYSGQSACWVTSLMHMMGYTNVRDLKWGMSSWNEATSGPWKSKISNALVSKLVQTGAAKPPKGELPKLNTGKTQATDILRVRVETVFAEGFDLAKVSNSNISGYYLANYWKPEHYEWGHLDGAVQYSPKEAFTLDVDLKTLPTDTKIAVYCYTGQTSALVAAYLRVLGYDAKSILYGVNAMAYDTMPGTRFNPDADVHNYELKK